MVATTTFDSGSMRVTVLSKPLATQTAPAPTARSVGVPPTEILLTSFFRSGSIRETVLSSPFRTQTAPSPMAMLDGDTPTGIPPRTLFVLGSMTATELGATEASPAPSSPPATARNATVRATARTDAPPSEKRAKRLRRRPFPTGGRAPERRSSSRDASCRRIACSSSWRARLGSRPSSSTRVRRSSW